ncbi:MAG: MATE family efflux transporter, partial [Firmicutes bacterium]|nr:MATE family efflux transporter [Bacillota bacterium]
MRRKKKNVIQLDNQPLFSNKFLLKLLWPLLVEQFLLFAVGLIDSMMVASVGEAAVSAVSLVDSIIILMINIMAALATGGAVVVGQYLG